MEKFPTGGEHRHRERGPEEPKREDIQAGKVRKSVLETDGLRGKKFNLEMAFIRVSLRSKKGGKLGPLESENPKRSYPRKSFKRTTLLLEAPFGAGEPILI